MAKPKRRLIYVIHHLDHVIEKTTKYGSSSKNFSVAKTFRQAIRKATRYNGEIERIFLTGKNKGLCLVFTIKGKKMLDTVTHR